MSKERLLYLEILRFALAFSVLVLHYVMFIDVFFKDQPNLVWNSFPLNILKQIFFFGSYAVPGFWQLSGFIFFWLYSGAIKEKRETGKTFFIKRFSRLYPLHFITLCLTAILNFVYLDWNGTPIPPGDTVKNFILQLGFASAWGPETPRNFNGPIWSVSVEVLVYAYFFILMLWFGPRKSVCLINVLWSKILTDSKAYEGGFADCCLFFFAGGLAYLIWNDLKKQKRILNQVHIFLGTCLGVSALFIVWGVMTAPKTIMLLPGSILIIWLSEFKNPCHRILQKIMESLGNVTYGTYLWHFPFNVFLIEYVKKNNYSSCIFTNSYFILSYFLIIIIGSLLCFSKIEAPLQALLRKKIL